MTDDELERALLALPLEEPPPEMRPRILAATDPLPDHDWSCRMPARTQAMNRPWTGSRPHSEAAPPGTLP